MGDIAGRIRVMSDKERILIESDIKNRESLAPVLCGRGNNGAAL
jgi:hypothetical protein